MCYSILYMLEWMWKRKYRIKIPRTQGLRGSILSAYIHGGVSEELYLYYVKV